MVKIPMDRMIILVISIKLVGKIVGVDIVKIVAPF